VTYEQEMREKIFESALLEAGNEPIEKILQRKIDESVKPEDRTLYLADMTEELLGYGPIRKLFNDPAVSEVLVDGPVRIFAEKEGVLHRTSDKFTSKVTFDRFIKKILNDIDRVADQRHPMVDGTLPDGTRVHVALPPITELPTLSFRRHQQSFLHLDDLFKRGMFSQGTLDKIKEIILAKKNILICGATGTGKTTLLRSLINETPPEDRVISVEDTKELNLQRENSVSLLTRVSLENLFPSITLTDLLRNALRMRPDRIVVGEIRSEEALVFLDAVSTGHRGSMSSIHGSSAAQALARLEHLVSRGAPQWSLESIRKLIYEGVDVVIAVRRENKNRQVFEVMELAGLESFGFLLNPWEVDY
jgi:pilus assembly protein CpaF